MRQAARIAIFLAVRALRADRRATLCYALALAAMLTPLLTLLALKNGLVDRMTRQLTENPATLQVLPVGAGMYDADFFNAMRDDPGVAFVVPRTRTISARMLGARIENGRKVMKGPALMPTASGDPLLKGIALPGPGETVLTAEAALALSARTGDRVRAWTTRTRDRKVERAELMLRVSAVLPPAVTGRAAMVVPLETLIAVENFLDGYGQAGPGWVEDALSHQRESFASFRLYANDIRAVEPLRARIAVMGHHVRTRSAEIATVLQTDRALGWLFWLIAVVAGGGFWLSLAASLRANVENQRAVVSMFRLIGADDTSRFLFPLAQAGLILAAGLVCTVVACLAIALAVESQAEALLGDGAGGLMRLGPGAALGTLALLILGGATAAMAASLAAVRVGPEEVLRHA